MKLLQKKYKQDLKGKSPAFFDLSVHPKFNITQISFLKKLSKLNNGGTVRICLHNSKKKKLHNMIIFMTKKSKVQIHAHKYQDETYQIIYGKMNIKLFSKQKKYLKNIILDPKKNILFRVNKNIFHVTTPLTNYVVFHESRVNCK